MSVISINGADVITGIGADITIAGVLIGIFLLGVFIGRMD